MDGPSLGVQAWGAESGRFDRRRERLLSMSQIVRIGLDIAKRWFQVRGVDEGDREVFNRKLPRRQGSGLSRLAAALRSRTRSLFIVALLGSRDRTAGPSGATDLAELREALCQARQVRRPRRAPSSEAASRPDMRFVPVKTEEQQAALTQHTSRQLLIDQRDGGRQLASRSQFAEFGVIEKRGIENLADLVRRLGENDPDVADIPQSALAVMRVLPIASAQSRRTSRSSTSGSNSNGAGARRRWPWRRFPALAP